MTDPHFEVFSSADLVNWKPSPEYLAGRKLAKTLAEEAKKLDAPPQYHCTNRVRVWCAERWRHSNFSTGRG
jgi:hypothetical protein